MAGSLIAATSSSSAGKPTVTNPAVTSSPSSWNSSGWSKKSARIVTTMRTREVSELAAATSAPTNALR